MTIHIPLWLIVFVTMSISVTCLVILAHAVPSTSILLAIIGVLSGFLCGVAMTKDWMEIKESE